jgi:hypothetical protein
MRTTVRFAVLSLVVLALLGWMLATPILKINHSVADGMPPVPPPPFSAVDGITLADGMPPVPPPPFSAVDGIALSDGVAPILRPPFNL